MKIFRILILLGMCCIFGAAAISADTIFLDPPVIYPDTPENRNYVTNALLDAAFYLETIYEDQFVLSGSFFDALSQNRPETAADADFTLTVQAVNQPDSKIINLNLQRNSDGRSAEPMISTEAWQPGAGNNFGRSIYYMWASIHDFLIGTEVSPPRFIDEFPVDMIPKSAIPVKHVQLYPYSIAIAGNGNVIVAANSIAMELDRHFRILGFPGKVLVEEGNYTYAYGVDITPGGTVYFRPSTGSDIYALYAGVDRPKRIRTGFSGAGPFVVLPDGSSVLVDIAQQRATRFAGRDRIELDFFPQEYSYVTAISDDPEGNIWVKDTMDKHIRIYSPEGKLVNAVLPLASAVDLGGVRSIAVYRNGEFLLLSPMALMKFTKTGEPMWRISQIPSPDSVAFAQVMDVGVDSDTGLIYLTDLSGRRIFKLLDIDYAEAHQADIGFEEQFMEINGLLAVDPYDSEAFSEKARLYEENGAIAAAITNWERVLEADPFAYEAEDRIAALEMTLLKRQAGNLRDKTLEVLHTLGTESARQVFSETVQVYEQILYRNPGDTEADRELRELREEFQLLEGGATRQRKPIQVVDVKIDKLFPSLLQFYKQFPAGMVTVRNTLEEEITDVRASLTIKNFMDFPSETDVVSSMKPGETVEMDLPVQFNRAVFSLEEDLPIQVQVIIRYTVGGEEQQVETYKTSTLFRRTALSWDDSNKLAAFIMPNEEIVSRFSHRIISSVEDDPGFRFSSAFMRTATLCDAVGAYRIDYIEDPSSPISAVLEDTDVVDTVRFPRTTLYYQSGDCDDSTALICSLLESAGIATAIMTSPGHVFFAFDTGEPAANAWQYESEDCETILHDGHVWIPVEATILYKGFFEAWKEASRDLRRYSSPGEIEFLPVRESWKTYPSLPLPESALTIVEPAPERIRGQRTISLTGMKDGLYTGMIAALERSLDGASERAKAKTLNKIGILHARFGEDFMAESSFQRALDFAPQSVSSYINLANLKLLQDDPREALVYLEQGRDIRSTSAVINALLAKTYYQIGDRSKAEGYYRIVQDNNPEMAEPLAYIGGEAGTARAADAGSTESLYWDIEEE